MAEVPAIDTSSYKSALPVGKSPLDTVQQLGTIQQQAINIDQSKLKLMNDRFAIINNELSTLANDENITHDKVIAKMNTLSKMGLVPKPMLQEFYNDLPKDPKQLKASIEQTLQRGMSVLEKLNFQYGVPGIINTGQAIIPTVTSPRFGVRATNAPIQTQVPPTASTVNPVTMQPQMLGPQGYQGAPPGVGVPLPVAPQIKTVPGAPSGAMAPIAPPPAALPVAPAAEASKEAPLPVAPATPAIPQPSGPVTGAPPLFDEGKKDYTADQALATQKMTAVKPALEALKLMEGLQSGPGTEAFNRVVAGLKTWGVIPTTANDPTAVYQEVNKYLNQYIQQSGSRSDADLAQKEMSNPNITTQINPALIKLTQNTIAQDRIQAARPGAFKSQDYSKYGQHRSQFPQSMSIEAAAFDLFPQDKRKEVWDQNLEKAKKGNKEAIKFFKTLEIMREQNMHSE